MKTNRSRLSAFSLIEISIVILIIGILIAGISNGIDLYKEFKFQSAQNLTLKSPVTRINDLALWLETTLSQSFQTQTTNETSISQWNNITPYYSPKRNALNYSTNPQPKYYQNIINGLPAIRFSKDAPNCMFVANDFDNNSENITIFITLTLISSPHSLEL